MVFVLPNKRGSIVRRAFVFCLLMVMSLCAIANVGRIEAGEGDIRVIAEDGTIKPSDVGASLNPGDVVSTAGEESWAILRMVDGASFTLRPNSRLRIDKYRYDEEQPSNNSSFLSLLKGSLRAITGLVGKQTPSAYAVQTPTATIGIRGTDHETVVVDEEHASAHVPAGTYDSVNAGETVMHNEQGDLSIKPGGVGYLQHGRVAPKMLNYRPAFLQRNRDFEQRHGIVSVLGKIHKSVGNGAFTAHPDLRERLKNEMSRPPEWKPQARNGNQRNAKVAQQYNQHRPGANPANKIEHPHEAIAKQQRYTHPVQEHRQKLENRPVRAAREHRAKAHPNAK